MLAPTETGCISTLLFACCCWRAEIISLACLIVWCKNFPPDVLGRLSTLILCEGEIHEKRSGGVNLGDSDTALSGSIRSCLRDPFRPILLNIFVREICSGVTSVNAYLHPDLVHRISSRSTSYGQWSFGFDEDQLKLQPMWSDQLIQFNS